MASSPSIKRHIPLAHSSPNNCNCPSNIPLHCGDAEFESDTKDKIKMAKYRFSRGHALIRKQLQKSEILQYQKTFGRRRFTFSGHQEHKVVCKKRRRFTSVALPTKFLLGGNITDPLNLRSLEDEKINQQLNAFTPESSPMPMSRHRTQVQVLIPPNIYDPLNLNTGEEIEFNLLSAKPRKRRRHRKSKREEHESAMETSLKHVSHCDSPSYAKNPPSLSLEETQEKEVKVISVNTSSSEERTVTDKIVSPVVPQGSPAKFYKRFHSRSFSKETDEKVPANKQVIRRRRSKGKMPQSSEAVKFRPNNERFSCGNYATNQGNWCYSSDMNDQRFRFFNKELFSGKDVLDIGCNTGHVTLYIAKYMAPRKILGIDIDKKLVDIAQRNARSHLSNSIAKNVDFPKSLAVMYGPLAKLTLPSSDVDRSAFPNNATFMEANYVPSCDDHLELQRPVFDTILCLRVTKWIHLNWGDEGLKMAFKRMFAQLRTGGHLILEPQPWFTYSAKKKITPAIYKHYCSIELKPEKFCDYLLSKEVGFSECELIGSTFNCVKDYRQPIYILTKGIKPLCEQSVQINVLSPNSFHSEQWQHHPEDQESCTLWQRHNEVLSDYSRVNMAHHQ